MTAAVAWVRGGVAR